METKVPVGRSAVAWTILCNFGGPCSKCWETVLRHSNRKPLLFFFMPSISQFAMMLSCLLFNILVSKNHRVSSIHLNFTVPFVGCHASAK